MRWFGPIVVWELTRLARRRRYFFVRAGYAAYVCFMMFALYQSARMRQEFSSTPFNARQFHADFAADFAQSFALLQFQTALLFTTAYAAAAIAVERERRTLEFLLCTKLSATDIVLGKWLARSANALMLLLAGFGVLGIAQILGGISGERLWLVSVLSVTTTLTVSAVAIFASARTSRVAAAQWSAYVWVIVLLFGPLLLLAIAELLKTVRPDPEYPWTIWLTWFSGLPATTVARGVVKFLANINPFAIVLDAQQNVATPSMWPTLLLQAIATVWCLRAAVRQLRPAAIAEKQQTARRGPLSRRFIPAVDGRDPICWKDYSFGPDGKLRLPSRITMLTAATVLWLAVVAWYLLLLRHQVKNFAEVRDMACGFACFCFGACMLTTILQGANSVTNERRCKTWNSLRTTPLAPAEILDGKMRAVRRNHLVLLAVLVGPAFLVGITGGYFALLAWLMASAATWVMLDFFAAIGVRQSLLCKSTLSAQAWGICIFGGLHSLVYVLAIVGFSFQLSLAAWEVLVDVLSTTMPMGAVAGYLIREMQVPGEQVAHHGLGPWWHLFAALVVVAYALASRAIRRHTARKFEAVNRWHEDAEAG